MCLLIKRNSPRLYYISLNLCNSIIYIPGINKSDNIFKYCMKSSRKIEMKIITLQKPYRFTNRHRRKKI